MTANTSWSGSFFPPNCLPKRASANTTKPSSLVYRFAVFTTAYAMAGPTVKAVLDGSVQGVVVHAKKSRFQPLSSKPHFASK